MNKSLHVLLIKIYMANWNMACISHHYPRCWNTPPTAHCAHIHCSVSISVQQASMNVSGCHSVFPHGGTQWHTFASFTFPCQTPFCQTASLLPSVTWQQNVMGYWWEGSSSTAIPPMSTSDAAVQRRKIGGTAFWAALTKGASPKSLFSKTLRYLEPHKDLCVSTHLQPHLFLHVFQCISLSVIRSS